MRNQVPDKKTARGAKITSSSRSAINKLTLKKKAYVEARAAGATIKAAAAEAGVSRRHGHNLENDASVQAAYRELMQKAFPNKELVRLIKGGANATMPVFDVKGRKLKDRPDWRTRKPYIDMVREDGGYVEKKENTNATMISVTVHHVGASVKSKSEPEATTKTERAPRTVQLLEG